ncbi:hypothetical protein NPX13_g6402 [Xylaria arbuscula]|uniref:Uncharacterized protein n=1 Tax=Xylaria arbuscula TaxID=114810 RepID=A0A9W8NCN8_9PEZI|nr:hypothetical protein NPX13_g6402 [Xylaria arbuscula]
MVWFASLAGFHKVKNGRGTRNTCTGQPVERGELLGPSGLRGGTGVAREDDEVIGNHRQQRANRLVARCCLRSLVIAARVGVHPCKDMVAAARTGLGELGADTEDATRKAPGQCPTRILTHHVFVITHHPKPIIEVIGARIQIRIVLADDYNKQLLDLAFAIPSLCNSLRVITDLTTALITALTTAAIALTTAAIALTIAATALAVALAVAAYKGY